jgi:hypothetical protein
MLSMSSVRGLSTTVIRPCDRDIHDQGQSLTSVSTLRRVELEVLRSFGVVGALVAAALALVIGVIAFNANSDDDKHRPFGGGPETGVVDHPTTLAELRKYEAARLVDAGRAQPVDSPPPAAGSTPRVAVAQTSASGGGGGAAAPRPAARSCNAGLLASLLATVGGLLGGSGSAC